MSMTREEAITLLKYRRNIISSVDADWNANEIEAINFALSALRPVSREQVEKIRGKFFQAGIDDVAQDTWRCSRCLVQEFGDIRGINFCPSCGAPMTDEAVDMVMERWEAMKDGSCD